MSFSEVGAEGFGGTWSTQDHHIYCNPPKVSQFGQRIIIVILIIMGYHLFFKL